MAGARHDGGPEEVLPVAVHRWFEGGEGWAYSPCFEAPWKYYEEIPQDEGEGIVQTKQGVALAFVRCEDPNPLDCTRDDRERYILKLAILQGFRPVEAARSLLLDRLRTLGAPERRGPDAELVLRIPSKWLEATPRETSTSKGRWLRYLLVLVGVSFLASTIALAILAGVPHAEGLASDVRQKLLEPFGIKLPADASVSQVAEMFRRLYCKSGMVERYFPGKTLDDVRSAAKQAREIAGAAPRGDAGQSPRPHIHPDALFAAKRSADLVAFWEAIETLPDSPASPYRRSRNRFSWLLRGGEQRRLRDLLSAVARSGNPQSRRFAGTNPLGVLESTIVDKLSERPRPPWTGSYDVWFAREFSWRQGTRFPWDEQLASGFRSLSLLFCEDTPQYTDQRGAAETMYRWLVKRGVKGIDRQDVHSRPWFVGRCFVEFLSLRHLAPVSLAALQNDNGLAAKQLRKLPLTGWPPHREAIAERGMWSMVSDALELLAKRLGVENPAEPPIPDGARVQRIIMTVEEWGNSGPRLQRRIMELRNRYRDLEQQEKGLPPGNPRLTNILREKARVNEEIAKAQRELDTLLPVDSHARELWLRLTGAKWSERELPKS